MDNFHQKNHPGHHHSESTAPIKTQACWTGLSDQNDMVTGEIKGTKHITEVNSNIDTSLHHL